MIVWRAEDTSDSSTVWLDDVGVFAGLAGVRLDDEDRMWNLYTEGMTS